MTDNSQRVAVMTKFGNWISACVSFMVDAGQSQPMVIAGAQGCELWDYEGNTRLDFAASW